MRAKARTRSKRADDRELAARLRRGGLRVTASRLAVLRQLLRRRAPVTHGDLVAVLGGEPWDRATVFRNLNDLADAGLVHRVDLGDHVWRFEACAEDEPHPGLEHPHFVCNDCGTVECLPHTSVRIKTSDGPRALQMTSLEVQFKGRCDRCG